MAQAITEGREQLEAAQRAGDATRIPAQYAALGRLFQAHHLQEAAVAAYRHALAGDEPAGDDRLQWRYLLSIAAADSNDLVQAATHLTAVLAAQPDYAPAWIRLGRTELQSAGTAEARTAFEHAQALGESAAAHEGLARVELLDGNPQQAAGHLERALALQPQASRLYAPLAQAYRTLGRTDDLRRVAPQLAADGGVPVSFEDPWFDQLAGLVRSSQFYLQQGQARIAQQDYRGAAEQFRLAVQANPQDAAAHATYGRALEQLGAQAEAREQYSQALSLAPEHAQANYFLGAMIFRQGGEEAMSYFERAVAADPQYLQPRYLLAAQRLREARYTEAAVHYDALTAVQPQSLEPRYWLGMAHLMAGACEPALAALAVAGRIAAGNGLVLQASARAIAVCDGPSQALDTALEFARTVLEAKPDAESHATLALVLHARGDQDGALNELTAAERLLATDAPERLWYQQLRLQLQGKAQAPLPWPASSPTVRPQLPRL